MDNKDDDAVTQEEWLLPPWDRDGYELNPPTSKPGGWTLADTVMAACIIGGLCVMPFHFYLGVGLAFMTTVVALVSEAR